MLVAQSCLILCKPWTVASRASLSLDFTGKNTGVGSHSLLQGMFPTQGLNGGLLHCREILYRLSHQIYISIKLLLLLKKKKWTRDYVMFFPEPPGKPGTILYSASFQWIYLATFPMVHLLNSESTYHGQGKSLLHLLSSIIL